MQKISCYLYPNRIELLADISGFNVEYTNVYQRIVKIYRGIDNVIEFDIKNADQKRIDLSQFIAMKMNIMDASGQTIITNPLSVQVTDIKGIAKVTIPKSVIAGLSNQFLKYTILALKSNNETVVLYTNSKFDAIGTIELMGDVLPVIKPERVFNSFSGEIDYEGNVRHHSSAIATKFYESIPQTSMSLSVYCVDFIGTVYVEATRDSTISVESFKNADQLRSWTASSATTTIINFNDIDIQDYCYFRVVWHNPLHGILYGVDSAYNILNSMGAVDKVIAI